MISHDYNLGLKYNLEVVDTLNEDGNLHAKQHNLYWEDRFDVRKNCGGFRKSGTR